MLSHRTLVFVLSMAAAACAGSPAPPRVPVLRGRLPIAMQTPPVQLPPLAPSANVEPAPPPVYDLAADVAVITSRAKTELGESVRVAVTKDVFVLIAAPGWNAAALASSQSLTINAIDAYFNGRFDKKPARAIAVYLFPEATTYQGFCKRVLGAECGSPFGVYYSDPRRIVMNAGPGLGTLTHELVHPIVEADFPSAPTWLNEGLASLFEAPVMPRVGEIHGVKNWRYPRLIQGMNSSEEKNDARLDALFTMSDGTFRDAREKLHYATARYVCQWLDQKGLLWRFYRTWRDHSADDPTGEASFTEVVGMSPAKANVEWTTWVRAL